MKIQKETKKYKSQREYLLEQAQAFKEDANVNEFYKTELSKYSDKQQIELSIELIRFLSTYFSYERDEISVVNEKGLTKELSRIFKVYNNKHGLISDYAFLTCITKHTFAVNFLKSINREDLIDADSYSFYKNYSEETIH